MYLHGDLLEIGMGLKSATTDGDRLDFFEPSIRRRFFPPQNERELPETDNSNPTGLMPRVYRDGALIAFVGAHR